MNQVTVPHKNVLDETAKIIAKLALENIYYFTEENHIY
jgi:hypothetical protein